MHEFAFKSINIYIYIYISLKYTQKYEIALLCKKPQVLV